MWSETFVYVVGKVQHAYNAYVQAHVPVYNNHREKRFVPLWLIFKVFTDEAHRQKLYAIYICLSLNINFYWWKKL